jgi:molecular chaperone DnaK
MILLMQTPRVVENAEGTRTMPSIVARNQNGDLLIDVTVS